MYFFVERHGSGSTHGNTIYDCSEEKPSQSDNLWVVVWNPLFGFLSCLGFDYLKSPGAVAWGWNIGGPALPPAHNYSSVAAARAEACPRSPAA